MTSCKGMREANRIARGLVQSRLAACVNLVPMRSIYRWKGEVESTKEVLLIVKTRRGLFRRLSAHLRRLHSYELPELISLPVERGYKPYLDWLMKSVAP